MPYQLSNLIHIGEDQVYFGITHGLLGSHLGLAYQDSSGTPRLFHLAFHKRLRLDLYPESDWLFCQFPIDEDAGAQIVALLNASAKLYSNQISPSSFDYGINLFAGQGCIAADGSYEPKEGCDGYTCSSFIAEIFRSFGFELVDLNSWPKKWVNKVWGNAVICLLKADDASVEHISSVERNNLGLRLRPEELAAAAEVFKVDARSTYSDISARSREIMNEVIARCKAPPPPSPDNKMRACVDQYHADLSAQPLLSRFFEGIGCNNCL